MKELEEKDWGELQIFADIFIILARTGMNYSDFVSIDFNLAIKTIEQGAVIVIARGKTSRESIIPLFPVVRKILEKYSYNPRRYERTYFNKKI